MDAFSPSPPQWVDHANHGIAFTCPGCGKGPRSAQAVWINRRSPLYQDHRKIWQEFYLCECGVAWWGWNNERPPSPLQEE